MDMAFGKLDVQERSLVMKLKTDINVPAFLQAVRSCAGEVYFTTPEGDHLNMNSTLSQFIFTTVIADKLGALDGSIICQDEADEILLRDYCV